MAFETEDLDNDTSRRGGRARTQPNILNTYDNTDDNITQNNELYMIDYNTASYGTKIASQAILSSTQALVMTGLSMIPMSYVPIKVLDKFLDSHQQSMRNMIQNALLDGGAYLHIFQKKSDNDDEIIEYAIESPQDSEEDSAQQDYVEQEIEANINQSFNLEQGNIEEENTNYTNALESIKEAIQKVAKETGKEVLEELNLNDISHYFENQQYNEIYNQEEQIDNII